MNQVPADTVVVDMEVEEVDTEEVVSEACPDDDNIVAS
jgi:hypothetical protein